PVTARDGTDRLACPVALGDDRRLLLARPTSPPARTREHFNAPDRLRHMLMLRNRHVSEPLSTPRIILLPPDLKVPAEHRLPSYHRGVQRARRSLGFAPAISVRRS